MKKLLPLSVPWMISPSNPSLRLVSTEDGEHFVQFVGFFGYESSGDDNPNETVITVESQNLVVNSNIKDARYQLISLTLVNAGWIKRSPQYSDREVVNEALFDWSAVKGRIATGESITGWQSRFMTDWIETKICPNPSLYIVENSDWDVGVNIARWDLKHFLILGEYSYIEVLAQDCQWVSEGALIGW